MRYHCHRCSILCFVPPYVLEHLAESLDAKVRRAAVATNEATADARATRRTMQALPGMATLAAPGKKRKHRLIYNAQHKGLAELPGTLARAEGDAATGDAAVDEAYVHSGTTYDFYQRLFQRESLDGQGMSLVSSVHVGRNLNNAFWTGQQMAYGDGDGQAFVRFTKALDVVGHELTHGVIAHESNLNYKNESGALNEHFADVFGMLILQWKKRQRAEAAPWLVGADIMGPGTTARALRDFGPDKAFVDDPLLGTDAQPKHMRDKYTGTADNGGVHINSGIPNHAFYLFAKACGGNACETPGAIWYAALRQLSTNSDFGDMVRVTRMIATDQHGAGSVVEKALSNAWKQVGL